jgi:hypothetical protein
MRSLFTIAAQIAATQEGRVSRVQLLDAGIDVHRIGRWLADGRLCRVHRGVYAIGQPAPSLRAEYSAAVLACGPGAALSHGAAGQLLKILPTNPPPAPEVTVPTTARRARPGIVVHRVRVLHILDTCLLGGIRVTTAPRILLDIAPTTSPADLTRACNDAWIHQRTRPEYVKACIARNPHKPGARRLLLALGSDVTLSMLEDGFLALLRCHALALPRTNIDYAGDKVDCHWPQLGLTVELLSYRFHGSRQAFEADVARRRRSNHMAFTYGDVFERGEQTVVELARIAGWAGRDEL